MRAGPDANEAGPEAAAGDDDDLPMTERGDRSSFARNDDEGDDTGVIEINGHDASDDDDGPEGAENGERADADSANRAEGEGRRRGRRRGRRGGRRNRERGEIGQAPGLEPQPFIGDVEQVTADQHRDRRPPRADDARSERPAAISADEPEAAMTAPSHAAPADAEAAEAAPRAVPTPPAPAAAPIIAPPPVADAPVAMQSELPRHRQRALAEPSQPKIERVVVRPDTSVDTTAEVEAERPARKGWWSRRFGGE